MIVNFFLFFSLEITNRGFFRNIFGLKFGFNEKYSKYLLLNKQKIKMEEIKKATQQLDVNIEAKVAEVRKEAEKKIVAMTNKAATVYYKDDDSIATMEEGKELISAALPRKHVLIASSTPSTNKINPTITLT